MLTPLIKPLQVLTRAVDLWVIPWRWKEDLQLLYLRMQLFELCICIDMQLPLEHMQ